MKSKNKTILILFVIILVSIIAFAFFSSRNNNDKTSLLIDKLKSIDPKESGEAEKELVRLGNSVAEHLRKDLHNEATTLKYCEMVKTITKILKKDSDPFYIDEKSKIFVRNIIRIRNVLMKLGDRNALESNDMTVVLNYVESSYLSEDEMRELEKFFKSAGSSSIIPIMECYRKNKKQRQRGKEHILLLSVVDRNAIGILIKYLRDDDERIREMAADLLGYTEDKIDDNYHLLLPDYTQKMERKAELYFNIKSRIADPVYPLEYKFGYDDLRWSLGVNMNDESSSVADVPGIVAKLHKKFQDTRAVAPLIEALDDPSPAVREAAIKSLGLIGDERATIPITRFLKNEGTGNHLELEAITALGYIGDKKAVRPLLDYFRSLKNTLSMMEICYTIRSLGMIGSDEAVDILVGIVEEKYPDNIVDMIKQEQGYEKGSLDYHIRSRAIIALGLICDKRAMDPLIRTLLTCNSTQDRDSEFPSIAAFSLGLIGDERAVEPLKIVMHYSKEPHSDVMRWAIGEIHKKTSSIRN